jgi:hypothetical protein
MVLQRRDAPLHFLIHAGATFQPLLPRRRRCLQIEYGCKSTDMSIVLVRSRAKLILTMVSEPGLRILDRGRSVSVPCRTNQERK